MSNKSLSKRSKLHILGIVVSLGIISIQPLLPERKVTIHPTLTNKLALYADGDWGGKSSVRWVDEKQTQWQCDLQQSQQYPVCGFALALEALAANKNHRNHDFTQFHSIEIDLQYQGDAPKIRFFMRNHNPLYSDASDDDSYKFNSILIATEEINKGPVKVKLEEFSVADWWLKERNIPRDLAAPEFNNILALGVDYPFPHVFGQHNLTLNQLVLIGHRIPKPLLYSGLFYIWIIALGLDALWVLSHSTIMTKLTRNKPQEQKKVAPIEGRGEFVQQVERCYGDLPPTTPISILLIQCQAIISQDENVIDSTREDAKTVLLQLVGEYAPKDCILTQWDEETLLLLYPQSNLETIDECTDKMQRHFAEQFEKNHNLLVGLATSTVEQPFMQLLQHASDALYRAKSAESNKLLNG